MEDQLEVKSLRLPLSGNLFHWRADLCWRRVSAQQAAAEAQGVFVPQEREWIRWTGIFHGSAAAQSFSKIGPSWWLIYDELPSSATPVVRLGDGTQPPILVLERIWMCEWVSFPQAATVSLGGETSHYFVHPPRHL